MQNTPGQKVPQGSVRSKEEVVGQSMHDTTNKQTMHLQELEAD